MESCSQTHIHDFTGQCGFHDSNYDPKKFTACDGLPPRKYRKTVECPDRLPSRRGNRGMRNS